MLILLIVTFSLSIVLTAMSLAWRELSTPHLKHWAQKGEPTSKALYPLKARGSAVLLTVEMFRALVVSATFVILAVSMNSAMAWIIGAIILFVVFLVLSELYFKPFGTLILAYTSRPLLALVNTLKFVTVPLGRVFDRFIEEQPVTLTRAELHHMLTAVVPADTDLSQDELRIVKHALSFGDKTVHDIMTPRSVIASVKEDEVLSPLLLDELHQSGHSRFPVLAEDGGEAVGILYIKDLVDLKAHSKVGELMHKPVHFVNETRELDHVLQAFLRTKQHMFLVVNSFAEITGLITIEDVVEQILGKPIIDEFDKYDSMRDVAEARAKIVRKQVKMVE
jgi:CBS domain containing-hemolysin-like protein